LAISTFLQCALNKSNLFCFELQPDIEFDFSLGNVTINNQRPIIQANVKNQLEGMHCPKTKKTLIYKIAKQLFAFHNLRINICIVRSTHQFASGKGPHPQVPSLGTN
jgi:hypothetical protein